MKKHIKIVLFNMVLLFALLFISDTISILLFESRNALRSVDSFELDYRLALPYYKDKAWARPAFMEKAALRAEYKSYYGWRKSAFHGEAVNVDSAGIRQTTQKKGLTNSDPLVIFLGGSTMWGTGSNDENTIPSIFAQGTQNNFRVENYGESGYCAYQSYIFMQIQVVKEQLKPGWIISYDGINNNTYPPHIFSHTRENQIKNIMKGADTVAKEPRFNKDFLKPTRYLLARLRSKLTIDEQGTYQKQDKSNSKRQREAAFELLESWLLIKEFSEHLGAQFLCILQPHAFVGHPNLDHLQDQTAMKQFKERFQHHFEYYNDVYDLMEEERYRGLKDNFLDFSRLFDDIPALYIDGFHVTPIGNRIVADSLLSYLAL